MTLPIEEEGLITTWSRNLSERIESLHQFISELETKLEPVLSPIDESPDKLNMLASLANSSPSSRSLLDQLQFYTSQIEREQHRIIAIRDRCQL